MDLNTLKHAPGARKNRKRVGRGPGSTRGKTAGRGMKGQKSRSGYRRRAGFEGGQMPLHRRLPKRGFRHLDRHPVEVVNVDTLGRIFEDGAEVTAEAIIEAGLVGATRGGVKVLGRGELTRKLLVTVHAVSPGARAKIEAAGGTVALIAAPKRRRTKGPRTVDASAPSGEEG